MNNIEDYNQLGIRVIKLREERDLSQGDLATMAGIDRGYLIDIEKGRRNVSLGYLARISWSLGMSLSTLLSFEQRLTT